MPDQQGERMRTRVVLAVIVALMVAAFVAACGGDSVTGTYKWVSGEESVKALSLEIKDDGTFVLSGDSEVMGNVSIQGEYTTEGDKITLTMSGDGGSTESEVGTYADGKLTFEDVVWQKQ
jgi:hypothetical protein